MPIARQVMILTKEGLLLLDHRFQGESSSFNETDPDLVSGMLSAILSVAKETGGGIVQTIHQDKYNVIISEGERVYCLLFIDEESRELENIAKMIVSRFELKYQNELDRIVTDLSLFKSFTEDLEEIHAQIFKVDAELLSKLIPEVSEILNVSIYEKPMNHQVYSGPRDSFVNEHDQYFQELVVGLIEAQAEFVEKTLEFHSRTVMTFRNRVIFLEDLGSHVLLIIGNSADELTSKMKKIRKRAGILQTKK